MISETDASYIAGLFDGEGSITYKQYTEKKKKRDGSPRTSFTWRIVMEISMTDESVIRLVHNLLGCGTVRRKPREKSGHLMQWRWRCGFRDAYYVALLLHPYVHVKLEKINKIIKHYSYVGKEDLKAKVIDTANHKLYKQRHGKETAS